MPRRRHRPDSGRRTCAACHHATKHENAAPAAGSRCGRAEQLGRRRRPGGLARFRCLPDSMPCNVRTPWRRPDRTMGGTEQFRGVVTARRPGPDSAFPGLNAMQRENAAPAAGSHDGRGGAAPGVVTARPPGPDSAIPGLNAMQRETVARAVGALRQDRGWGHPSPHPPPSRGRGE